MSPPSRKQLKKGAYGYGYEPRDEDFLAVERSPWEASASGIGYNAKFDDDYGYERGTGAYTDSDSGLVNKLPDEAMDGVHQNLMRLLDDQVDQPAGEILGGGGPVSDNADDNSPGWKGSGRKGPRYAPKTGPIGNMKGWKR